MQVQLGVSMFAVSLLAACGADEAGTHEVAEAPAAAEDFSQPDFTHQEGEPWCDMVDYQGEHVDCALQLRNDSILYFDYTADAAVNEWGEQADALEVTHRQADGTLLQTFNESVGRTFAQPELADVDNDGDMDLMIPTYTGNVNTTWRVWQQIDGTFHFAGEVSGLGLEYDPDTGFTSISSRGSAVTYFREVYRLGADGLTSAYTLETDVDAQRCGFIEGPGFASSGLDRSTIITRCQAGMGEE